MKNFKLFLLAVLLPMIFGCTEDFTDMEKMTIPQTNEATTAKDDNGFITLRSPESRQVAFKYWSFIVGNPEPTSTISCVVPFPPFELFFGADGWLEGNGTHLGKIDKAASPWTVTGCVFEFVDNTARFKFDVEGTMTGANGDSFDYSTVFYVDQTGNAWGTVNVIEGTGTGKFQNATGTFESTGTNFSDMTAPVIISNTSNDGEGYLMYPK